MSKEALSRKLLTGICAAAAMATLAVVPSHASALGIIVNNTGDGTDATPGNSVCETATGNGICTLRAAIGEANGLAGTDSISFNSGTFDGTAATSTISIATALPLINTQIFIDGGSCVTGGGDPKPCTAVNANNGGAPRDIDAFIFFTSGATGSTLKRIAIFGAQRGIVSSGTSPTDMPDSVSIEGNWFGSNLNGSPASTADANSTGIDAAGNGWDIGGTTAQERNVFRPNFTEIRIVGGDNNVIAGNYFGVNAAGAEDTSLNSPGVRIHSTSSVGDGVATGNVVGGVDPATPGVCDGPCNVMAQSGNSGNISLASFSGFNPAGLTTIKGNFIGLLANGAQTSAPNLGIIVGDADNVTIGGSSANDRNFIGGGATGILADDPLAGEPSNLVIRNNFIGVEPDGTGEVAPTDAGVQIGASLPLTDRPQILDNTIAGDSTAGQDALRLSGAQGLVTSNNLGRDGANTARPLGDDVVQITGSQYLLASNVIFNGRSTGVNISGTGAQGNILNANGIQNNGAASSGPGVRIQAGASQNILGNQPYTTPANINTFVNNAGDAIELLGDGTDENHLLGNLTVTGFSGGADQFVDLGGDGFGNVLATGPNNGVQAPTITFANASHAEGTAQPGALVVLYTGTGTQPEAMPANANAMADGSGNWAINYPTVADGTKIYVNQTPTLTSNTSELASGLADGTPPAAPNLLNTNPASGSNENNPSFKGTAEAGSTVQVWANGTCNGAAFATGNAAQFLNPGFAFSVADNSTTSLSAKATDAAGNVGPCSTPITYVETTPAPPPATPVTPAAVPTPGATGQRAAALKKCKKKKSARARRNCKKRANKLPV